MTQRVLHATEAMGGGIVSALVSLTARQAEAGAEVTVLYPRRPDTPTDDDMHERFDDRVTLIEIGVADRKRDLVTLFRSIRSYLRSGQFDALHLHSSFGGVVGRIAAKFTRSRTKTFYSPHGFAFLRLNESARTRAVYRTLERRLAKIGSMILISQTELEIAERELHPARAYLVQTGVRSETVGMRPRPEAPPARPVVGMVGRVMYQKAPWRFATVARALGDSADYLWIGGGEPADEAQWLGDVPVTITGWVGPDEVDRLVKSIDILLFPSLWEGKALSLIEAHAQGIPAVVSDVVGNRDTVVDGVTGFICADDSELIAATRSLVEDAALRDRMSLAAVEWSRTDLTDDNLGRETLAIYARDPQPTR